MKLDQMIRNALLLAAPVAGAAGVVAGEALTGPSSSQSPYLLGTQPSVDVVSVLTVGDAVNYQADGATPYRMVGIPDGLGAFDNCDGTFTVVMNQELTSSVGVVREHGLKGAFVSKWIIDRETFTVLHGEDLIKQSWAWTPSGYVPNTQPFTRFCSADLPELSAFYDRNHQVGYNGRIFMNGEESGTEGRAVAHLMDGNSFELPYLGKFAWENSVANPKTGRTTVVVGTDDGTGGQVYVYAGTKTRSTDPIAAAGLSNGELFGIKVEGFADEDAASGIPSGTKFTCYNLGDVSLKTGAEIEAVSQSNDVTSFNRPEDGCWDPKHPQDFYFVTTASFTGNSRLWRLRFKNPAKPQLGGKIDMLLDGSEGPKMMDNLTVANGKVLIQEDVGNNAHVGKIWSYDIKTDTVEMVAQHDPDRFTAGSINFLTVDEESSAIIPMDEIIGRDWFLATVQAHYHIGDPELIEGGQLVALHIGTACIGEAAETDKAEVEDFSLDRE